MIFRYKFLHPNSNYASNTPVYLPTVLKVDDLIVRLFKTSKTSTKENDYRLFVEYTGAIKEIYDDTKLHEDVASQGSSK